MKTGDVSRRALAVVLLCGLAAAFPGLAQDFGVTARRSGTNLFIEHQGQTGFYYRIHSAPALTGAWSVLDLELGTQGVQSWAQSDAPFYRVGRIPLTNTTYDFDGDGLADPYELQDPLLSFRDPDSDGDRISDGDEVHVFHTSPSSPYSGTTVYYDFVTNVEAWAAETGDYGIASFGWTSVGFRNGGSLAVAPAAGPGAGDFYIHDGSLFDNQNVIARPLYEFWVYVSPTAPAGVVQVEPWVKSSSDGWQGHWDSQRHAAQPGQWTLVSWDLSGLGAQVLADVDEWAVKVFWTNRTTWSGPVFVDTVHVMPQLPLTNLPPAITSVVAAATTVGKYQKFEVAVGLTNVVGLNPYDPNDVNLEATFTSPTGGVWKMWGFYMEDPADGYGRGKWKIRFAPNEPGAWTYQVRVSNAFGTNTAASSNFTCIASDQHGWLRVSGGDAHYFECDDRTPFYGIGYCRVYDADDEGLFADAQEHGVNLLHWWMAPWDTLLTVEGVGPGRERSTFYTYEQDRAAEIDRIVGYAEKYGVKLVFTIWPHDALRDFNYHKWRQNGSWQKAFDQKVSEPEWFINAFSELENPTESQKFFYDQKYRRYQEQLYRYIIARWGYSQGVGMWALVSELFGTMASSLNCANYQDPLWVTNKTGLIGQDPYFNMDPNQVDGRDYSLSWLTSIYSFFRTNDPFRRPATASNATDEYWDDGFNIVDVPQIHSYAEAFNWDAQPITMAKYHRYLWQHHNKPAFIGETGTQRWPDYQPEYLRACMWPALCSGAAATPMTWTLPAFAQFSDPALGPWLSSMGGEASLFSKFVEGMDFPNLYLAPADVQAMLTNEPAVMVVDSFESGLSPNWRMFGTGIVAIAISTNHASEGAQCLRMDINMDTWDVEPNPASGVYNTNLFCDWSGYWPDGVVRVDLFIPEFYDPITNPDGFLLGIDRDPRSIVEVTVESGGGLKTYSTTNEYGGWKKLTVGMLYNLELKLSEISTSNEAAHVRGIRIWFGDAGILRGPVYVDHVTAGRYAFNAWGMVSSNRDFAFAWVQDRQWTNTLTVNAAFQISGLRTNSIYNLEWWGSKDQGILSAFNANSATGTLRVTIPNFTHDAAVKVRRVGDIGATNHDVAVASISGYDWVLKSPTQRVIVLVVNQGSAAETVSVTLTNTTDGLGIGTNSMTLGAGAYSNTVFTWNCSDAVAGAKTLTARAATVAGETDTADNQLAARIKLVAAVPPWDSCDRLRRWAPIVDGTDGRVLQVSTNRFTEGAESFYFFYRAPSNDQANIGYDNLVEDWSAKTALVYDVYNEGSATGVQTQLRSGTNWAWYYSPTRALVPGWNTNLAFSFNAGIWQKEDGTNKTSNVPVGDRDRMQQLYIKLTGYTNAGVAYFDNVRLLP